MPHVINPIRFSVHRRGELQEYVILPREWTSTQAYLHLVEDKGYRRDIIVLTDRG